MEKKKTTTITSETHEVLIIRRLPEADLHLWCPECAAEVDMLKPHEAAAIAKVSTRTIFRWIEDAQIHHQESPGGNVLVCPTRLFDKKDLLN